MKEEGFDNLPADADDLSKHAPALLQLQGGETGFVVPENYFEEFTDRVVSMTAIPSDGGLVVPENYFEESEEQILFLSPFGELVPSESRGAQSDNHDTTGLVTPENYFEELPAQLEALVQLPSESGLVERQGYFNELGDQLESRIALESMLPKAEGETPEGYFGQMESELHVHIALDNLKQEEGFVVSENYFGELADRVLAVSGAVSLGSARPDNDIVENDPNIPDGYFEELPDRVLARVAEEENEKPKRGRIVVLAEWTKQYWKPVSAAASVALLIVSAWYFITNRDNGNGDLKNYDYAFGRPQHQPSIPSVAPSITDTASNHETPTMVADITPKKPKGVKPGAAKEVKVKNEEIIAQADQMDESMVIDFVAESNVIAPSGETLDPAMLEYLMNDNAGLDVFSPTDRP